MAVAYSVMQFQKSLEEDQDARSFLWDLNNSSKPELEFQVGNEAVSGKGNHCDADNEYFGQLII